MSKKRILLWVIGVLVVLSIGEAADKAEAKALQVEKDLAAQQQKVVELTKQVVALQEELKGVERQMGQGEGLGKVGN